MSPFLVIPRRLSRCFFAGLLTVLPLALTLGAVLWAVGFVSRIVGPETMLGQGLRSVGAEFVANENVAYFLGWVFVLALIFVLGVFVENRAARVLQRGADRLIAQIPILGGVYGTAKQLTGMLSQDREAELEGMSVVYCRFGAERGAMLLGLLATPERFEIEGREYHVVLVPTAPVPVGGALFFMPVESVQRAGMSIEAFTSVFVSMGVTLPQYLPPGSLRAAELPGGSAAT